MDGSSALQISYPGDHATPGAILQLAHSYAQSADVLYKSNSKSAEAIAPARYLALHSIELFLHAFLRARGANSAQLRTRGHRLWHAEFALVLGLDKKTQNHLQALDDHREYLIARYGPDQFDKLSHPNRMTATLKAIRDKAHHIPFSICS